MALKVKNMEYTMELKEAVGKAKEFARSVFADENPTSINLEQVTLDASGGQWKVVLSFERFRNASTVGAAIANLSGGTRAFKLFKVDNASGSIDSVEIWSPDE